jgi:hypothetical protein
MTIHKHYSLMCTSCSKGFSTPEDGWTFDSKEELTEATSRAGWHAGILVPNGSLWDFCPRCYHAHKNEET